MTGASGRNSRYIRNDADGRKQLYDIQEDPLQQRNLVKKPPKIRNELATKPNEHLAHSSREVDENRTVTQTDIEDGEVRDRLQDSYYLE